MANPAGIGHNKGPASAGTGFRVHCWRVARQKLLGAALPIEVVRMQVRRARDLGLDYKTYAGVRATTGRDLVAFLYSSNGIGVFRTAQAPGADILARIAAGAAQPHLGCAPGIVPHIAGARIGALSARALPVFGASWATMRSDIKAWLRDQRLPGDAVLMIGETDHEQEIMTAGGLAGFIPGRHHFYAGAADAV